jgi:threonine/homoserine/homoserine lactone efflux protein
VTGVPTGSSLAGFTLAALALIVVPGPSVLFVVSRGVALGRRAAVATAFGNEAGLVVQVVAVAFGLGAVVERSVVAFSVVKLLGAAYLVYLGVQAWRHRRALAAGLSEPEQAPRRIGRILREGFVVGATNPKGLLLFTSVLPQFVDPGGGSVAVQLLVLGAIFCAIALLCDSTWALLAGAARTWLVSSPRRLSAIGGSGGLVMIGLGAGLAVSERPKH